MVVIVGEGSCWAWEALCWWQYWLWASATSSTSATANEWPGNSAGENLNHGLWRKFLAFSWGGEMLTAKS